MIFAVIFAAIALGLASFAVYAALDARSRSIDAQKRTARHQQEHRLGLEDTGIRRHRAREEPSTEQLVAQPGPPARPDEPATALAASTPPEVGPYARLRESADDRARRHAEDEARWPTSGQTGPATAVHAGPRRPGNAPNFAEPPPARPVVLPPPGRIDRDR